MTAFVFNNHVGRFTHTIPQEQRDRSIGDPRGLVWRTDGVLFYITGMGSNNIVVMSADGYRAGRRAPNFTIEVGEGPTGIVMDGPRERLYVLNRFEASISVIPTTTEIEIESDRVFFFDLLGLCVELDIHAVRRVKDIVDLLVTVQRLFVV